MCIHCKIGIFGIATCIITHFSFIYLRGLPGVPWGFPATLNKYQGISQCGQDQGSWQ